MAPLEKTDLLQGTLDLLILKVVALGPVHGYGIAQRIRQISSDVLQVQQDVDVPIDGDGGALLPHGAGLAHGQTALERENDHPFAQAFTNIETH